MEKFLKSIPIPMCGLILAILSLGNLLIMYKLNFIGEVLGVIGAVLMIFVLMKIIFVFEHVAHDLKNPVIASVAPTFTMGAMVLCTYITRWFNPSWLKMVWLGLVAIHICLMIYFTVRFVFMSEVKMEEFYPSWFIVYCGCGVVPITAKAFFPVVGRIIFWVALIFYFILLPVVVYRVFIHRKFAKHVVPLVTITAAPGSLCLTGYLSGFDNINTTLVTVLLIVSQILYFLIVLRLPKMLKIEFYPSYAAFTFPLVISAIASSKTNVYFEGLGVNLPILKYLAILETILAFLIVVYVLCHYLAFIVKANLNKG